LAALLGLGAQRLKTKGEIRRELHQERELRLIESIGTARVEAESADALLIDQQRQRHRGAIALAMRLFPPGRKVRIGVDVSAHLNLALADGAAGGSVTPFDIAPTDPQPLEIAAVPASMRSDAHGALGLSVREADPREPVTAGPYEGAADLREQLRLVCRARERALADDQHPQLAIGLGEGALAATLFDGCHGANLLQTPRGGRAR